MTNASLAALDQDQLFQAALDASAGGDSAAAIACLTEALGRPDATAMTHYLLGAEYAQVRRYDSAIAQLEAALGLDRGLHVARLQLGMLYFGARDEARGVEALAALEELEPSHPLRDFAIGLRRLAHGEPAAALVSLERGLGLNADLPALNADMRRIMREIEQLGAAVLPDAGPDAADAPAEAEGGQHVLLSAYTFNRTH